MTKLPISPPRICFSPETLASGIARYTLNLSRGFLEQGASVDYYLTNNTGKLRDQTPEGVRTFVGKGSVRNSLFDFAAYLRRERPDVLITGHVHVTLMSLLARRLASVPLTHLVTLHTALSADDKSGHVRWNNLNTSLARRSYPRLDHLIAVSNAVADDAAAYLNIPRKRITTLYNPVVTPDLFAAAEQVPEHPWLQTKTVPVILGVGRLTEQKDFPTLVKAFAKVRAARPARLIILGEGKLESSLKTLVTELGLADDVSLPGFSPNPYAHMARADVFALSSGWEGLPTVLIEAMASGTTVVSTDCPGGSSEILEGGRYGTLVPTADPDALARALVSALDQPADAATLRARARDFSAEQASLNYLNYLGYGETTEPLKEPHAR